MNQTKYLQINYEKIDINKFAQKNRVHQKFIKFLINFWKQFKLNF